MQESTLRSHDTGRSSTQWETMYESRSLCYVIGDARKLQMDGVLRSVPSEAAERLFAPSQGSTTSPPASTPDGRSMRTTPGASFDGW
jgi:hypothetical protein